MYLIYDVDVFLLFVIVFFFKWCLVELLEIMVVIDLINGNILIEVKLVEVIFWLVVYGLICGSEGGLVLSFEV